MSEQPLSQCFCYWVRASLFIFHLHSPSHTNHLHKSPFWFCDLNNTFQKNSVKHVKTQHPNIIQQLTNEPNHQPQEQQNSEKNTYCVCVFPDFLLGFWLNHPISGCRWFPRLHLRQTKDHQHQVLKDWRRREFGFREKNPMNPSESRQTLSWKTNRSVCLWNGERNFSTGLFACVCF